MREATRTPPPEFMSVAWLRYSLGADYDCALVWGTKAELLALVSEIESHGQSAELKPATPLRPDEVMAALPGWMVSE